MKVVAFIVVSIVVVLLSIVAALCGDIELTWGAPAASNMVALYQVHYGTVKRTSIDPTLFRYQRTNSTSKTNFSLIVSNLAPGIWYFSAASLATNGLLSNFTTNEVAWTNRDFAPATLRLTGPQDALILQAASEPSGPWKTLAVITSSNQPLQLTAQTKQSFRTITTNQPPQPR